MNLEPTELESPSAGTGLEIPGQQCPPNGETERTTADGCLLGDVGWNLRGNAFFPAEIAAGTRPYRKSTTPPAASNTIFLQARRKPNDQKTLSEENKQFGPGGKGEKPPPWNAAVMVLFCFSGGNAGHGMLVVCASCFLSVFACLFVYCLLFYQVTIFQRAERHERRRGSSRSCTQPEGKHFLTHQPLEHGEDQQYPVRSYRKRFGERIDLVRFSCDAL